ncbi:MAG TPA: hypothetical protein VIF57_11550 [Polyangia bacterium]|jgi:hypothetical protein
MCRTFTVLAIVTCAVAAPGSRAAAATDGAPDAPVTPFIDSGNQLPDLEAPARGAGEDGKQPDARPDRGRWYGWQLLLADLGTTACIAGLESAACLLGYWGSGIGIHLAHGRPGLAGASLGLRAVLPGLGLGVGLAVANCPPRRSSPRMTVTTTQDGGTVTYTTGGNWDFCGLGEGAIGMVVGAVIASAIDAALAYERVPAATSPPPVARRPRLVEPRLAVTHDGFSLGLGAAF